MLSLLIAYDNSYDADAELDKFHAICGTIDSIFINKDDKRQL